MASLAEQLATLEAARASGVLTAEHDGSRVTYRSDRELAAAIGYLKAQIAGSGRVNTIVFETSKGLS